MKEYKLISGETKENLGIIKANNTADCALFIAINFPEHYYGANISSVEGGEFSCIPVYESDCCLSTPLEDAVRGFDMRMKIENNLCTTKEDDEGTSYIIYENLSIPCR